ncbi:MAG: hypothetical protein Q7K34_02705 [archaeon]|nr:hypothetical protein [archaeon]
MGEKKQGKTKKRKSGKKMEETKTGNEEKKAVEKKPENKSPATKALPNYVVVLFVIAGILLGVAVGIAIQPKATEPPVIVQPPEPKPAEKIRVTLLFDPACTFCEKYNTILDVFAIDGMPFEVTELAIDSPEGVKAIAQYNVKLVPTALVEIVDVTKYPGLKDAMDETYPRILGKYVVPEFNLNSSKIYSREYLETPVEEDCNASDARVRVNIFDNPFHEVSIRLKPGLDNALGKFDSNALKVRFEFLPTTTSTITVDENNVELFKRNVGYIVCASNQEKFRQMHDAIIGYYCDVGGDTRNLANEEILFCNASKNFGKPVPNEELEKFRAEIGAGIEFFANVLESCVSFTEEATRTSLERAVSYSIRIPATAVVACKYNVPFKAIDDAVCLADPTIEACQNDNSNEDANSS